MYLKCPYLKKKLSIVLYNVHWYIYMLILKFSVLQWWHIGQ